MTAIQNLKMITELKIMRGPNIWSKTLQQLVVVKLDPPPTTEIQKEALINELVRLFPSFDHPIKEHKTSSANESNALFISWLFALTALELQTVSAPQLRYKSVHLLGGTSHYAVFEYEHEDHGARCARVAAKILINLMNNLPYRDLEKDLAILQDIYDDDTEGPSTQEIINAAKARNIPVKKSAGDGTLFLARVSTRKKSQLLFLKTLG
jgi:cyanophycin synthetase